jgi:hypothetical protein
MRGLIFVSLTAAGLGCTLGPRAVERNRLRYNDAVKTTTEEQLLLNIVRLRYTDTPSSLALSSIAEQQEIVAAFKALPFFQAAAGGNAFADYGSMVLPQLELSGASRPTLSYTPLDDQEFTKRLFTPVTLEGTAYLAKTTWPISTVLRLYLENLNWVSNAETASGPTPKTPPEYATFLEGILALQRLQDRKLAALFTTETNEKLSDALPAGDNTPTAAVEAAKAGFEYRKDDKGGWIIMRKKQQPILRFGNVPKDDADFAVFCKSFKLNPEKRSFDLTTETLDPFLKGAPEAGVEVLDMETRSLLQVLFFVSNGVEVPPCHLASGIAPATYDEAGVGFDWDDVLNGLFKVKVACGKKRPANAHTAVQYKGYWFYIDESDRDTKATFALLIEVSRLELGAKTGSTPILTLPLGGR